LPLSSSKKPDARKSLEDNNGRDKEPQKSRTPKKQSGAAAALNSYMEYQKKSDDAYLVYLREQAAAEAELRREEIRVYYNAMEMLANAMSPPIALYHYDVKSKTIYCLNAKDHGR